MTQPTLDRAGERFGKATKAKLTNVAIDGEPEDQLRASLEQLIAELAELCGLPASAVTAVAETKLADLKTRPDDAISVHNAPAGFIEIKAPGKGGDPRHYTGHEAAQWEKLQPLPHLIYTDGNEWTRWRGGRLEGEVARVTGDVRTSGATLKLRRAKGRR